jgi:hypothetical protein
LTDWKRIVNYDKLDADLSAELNAAPADANAAALPVFIHTEQPLGQKEEDFLKRLGVSGNIMGQDLITATLSPRSIEELSGQPWVRYLKLSRKLRPLT